MQTSIRPIQKTNNCDSSKTRAKEDMVIDCDCGSSKRRAK